MGATYSVPDVKSKHYAAYCETLPSLSGKTIAITGTTTGLGNVAAKACVAKGARVVLLNRSSDRATASCEDIGNFRGDSGGSVVMVECDLQSFESARSAASKVTSLVGADGLDVLCNNAGVMALPDKTTGDGYEVQMQTNHLSHFLLTSLLMPSLETAAGLRGSARVVNHTSASRKNPSTPLTAKYLQKGTEFGGDGLAARWERYHQTKLANVVFTLALQERLDAKNSKVIACAAAPGLAASNLQATTAEEGAGTGMSLIMKFAQSAEDGTLPLLECMAAADVPKGALYVPVNKGMIGGVMGDGVTGLPKLTPPEALCSKEESKVMLWDESEKATGPFFAV